MTPLHWKCSSHQWLFYCKIQCQNLKPHFTWPISTTSHSWILCFTHLVSSTLHILGFPPTSLDSISSPLLVLLLPDLVISEGLGLSLSIFTPFMTPLSPLALSILYAHYSEIHIRIPQLSWAPNSCLGGISTLLSNSHLKLNMSRSKLLIFLKRSAPSQHFPPVLLATPSHHLLSSDSMESSLTSHSFITHTQLIMKSCWLYHRTISTIHLHCCCLVWEISLIWITLIAS